MSNEKDIIRKMKKNVLQRYEWDDYKGNALVNDFLQMSQIAERLKENDENAYNAFLSLLKDKIELQETCMERGKRLGRLNKQEAALRKADKEKRKSKRD